MEKLLVTAFGNFLIVSFIVREYISRIMKKILTRIRYEILVDKYGRKTSTTRLYYQFLLKIREKSKRFYYKAYTYACDKEAHQFFSKWKSRYPETFDLSKRIAPISDIASALIEVEEVSASYTEAEPFKYEGDDISDIVATPHKSL